MIDRIKLKSKLAMLLSNARLRFVQGALDTLVDVLISKGSPDIANQIMALDPNDPDAVRNFRRFVKRTPVLSALLENGSFLTAEQLVSRAADASDGARAALARWLGESPRLRKRRAS